MQLGQPRPSAQGEAFPVPLAEGFSSRSGIPAFTLSSSCRHENQFNLDKSTLRLTPGREFS